MVQAKSPSKMAIDIKATFSMDFSVDKAPSPGPTESSILDSLQIIELQVKVCISGPMEAVIRAMLRTVFVTETASTQSIKQLTRETGSRVRNREKGRLYLRVAVFSKDISKTI